DPPAHADGEADAEAVRLGVVEGSDRLPRLRYVVDLEAAATPPVRLHVPGDRRGTDPYGRGRVGLAGVASGAGDRRDARLGTVVAVSEADRQRRGRHRRPAGTRSRACA